MVEESSNLLMEINIQDNTIKENLMDMAPIFGVMEISIKEISKRDQDLVKAHYFSQME